MQKRGEGVFKQLNLIKNGDIDKEATAKYLDSHFDGDWKRIMTVGFQYCELDQPGHAVALQKRANFTKDECNIRYQFVIECINLLAFGVSKMT